MWEEEDRQGTWVLRRCDVFAGLAWLVFFVLAALLDVYGQRKLIPWVNGSVAAACCLTLTAYMHRGFRRIEREAFERGLRAGMKRSDIIDMRDRQI